MPKFSEIVAFIALAANAEWEASLASGGSFAPPVVCLQVSKYNKRWFELTADTLAYAGDPRELRESHIEVYAIHEMQYVKRLDDVRIEVSAGQSGRGKRGCNFWVRTDDPSRLNEAGDAGGSYAPWS
jgi:hypothetical protein